VSQAAALIEQTVEAPPMTPVFALMSSFLGQRTHHPLQQSHVFAFELGLLTLLT
jgi:hypothetical protein